MKLIMNISDDLAEALESLAKDEGTTRTALIRRMLYIQYAYQKQHWEKLKAAITKQTEPIEKYKELQEIANTKWLD